MQHLQILEASGLVQSEKSGRVRICRIHAAFINGFHDLNAERRRTGSAHLFDNLAAVLAE